MTLDSIRNSCDVFNQSVNICLLTNIKTFRLNWWDDIPCTDKSCSHTLGDDLTKFPKFFGEKFCPSSLNQFTRNLWKVSLRIWEILPVMRWHSNRICLLRHWCSWEISHLFWAACNYCPLWWKSLKLKSINYHWTTTQFSTMIQAKFWWADAFFVLTISSKYFGIASARSGAS